MSILKADFHDTDLVDALERMTDTELDLLPLGVIGFGPDETVDRYSRSESERSGLDRERVIGRRLFHEVAPCCNNELVAERYRSTSELDEQLDYVFTFRMALTPVRLRLLATTRSPRRYMVVTDRSER